MIAAAGLALVLTACVSTVPTVDLGRYVGHWYQPKGYEQPFTAGLVGITADYGVNADGTVSVFNRGYRGSCDGPVSDIVGTATVVDTTTNAKLEVRFPSVPITTVVPGQYWIIGLDRDYQWAVVSDSVRASLFVLSRTPQLTPEAAAAVDAIITDQGFDPARVQDFATCP